jgi:Protein of unknown function (DUF3040)
MEIRFMSASAFDPDGSGYSLSSHERKTLAEIARDLHTSDPSLAGKLTGDPLDHLHAPPTWIVRVCRVAFMLMPITLFVPFEWWAALAALASAVLAYRLLRARTTA